MQGWLKWDDTHEKQMFGMQHRDDKRENKRPIFLLLPNRWSCLFLFLFFFFFFFWRRAHKAGRLQFGFCFGVLICPSRGQKEGVFSLTCTTIDPHSCRRRWGRERGPLFFFLVFSFINPPSPPLRLLPPLPPPSSPLPNTYPTLSAPLVLLPGVKWRHVFPCTMVYFLDTFNGTTVLLLWRICA